MIAQIVVDNWKLPLFQIALDNNGYKYEVATWPQNGASALKVTTDNPIKLAELVESINAEAAKFRRENNNRDKK